MNIRQYDQLEGDDQLSETFYDDEIIFPNIDAELSEPSESLLTLFMLISFGYMLPWTAMGSLISYYKQTYSASFYVQLYCAYYLPGLPIALIQYRYDVHFDLKYKSENTYFYRGLFSYLVMSSILLGLSYFRSELALIILFFSLGICSWLCHGTASMLASMYPSSAIAYLQTGFRCPEVYSLVAVGALHLGKDATMPNLHTFHVVTAIVVLTCAIPWVYVVSSQTSREYFDIKDNRKSVNADPESTPLLAPLLGRKSAVFKVTSSLVSRENYLNTKNIEGDRDTIIEVDTVADQLDDNDNVNDIRNKIVKVENSDKRTIVDFEKHIESGDAVNITNANGSSNFSKNSSYVKPLGNTEYFLQTLENAAFQLQPSIGYQMSKAQFRRLFPLCLALFLIIFCSIFQSSFFCYVSSSGGRDIEQILYFVRALSDLVGRPLTRLPRPFFLQVEIIVIIIIHYLIIYCSIFFRALHFPKKTLIIEYLQYSY